VPLKRRYASNASTGLHKFTFNCFVLCETERTCDEGPLFVRVRMYVKQLRNLILKPFLSRKQLLLTMHDNPLHCAIKLNKITIYKPIIRPVWTYGIELWGCSKPSNTKILQTFQSKTLRKLGNVPSYISNITLRIPYVTEVIRTYAKNHIIRTARNSNQLIRDLFNQPKI
jgi:hypothetical protein